jgi:hypothetical protein
MESIDLSDLSLDWEMAVRRYDRDVRNDFFPDPLNNRDLFVTAKSNIESVITLSDYRPEPAESWDVPKPNLTLRHCINVTPVDRLVYQALADHLSLICDPLFSERSYGYRLRVPPHEEMFHVPFRQFDIYDETVRQRLRANPESVVVTVDVAQYYENVPFDILKRKLIELTNAKLGSPTRTVIDVLMQCLSRWSPYGKRGLPQNMFPSSLLGNAYLHSLDGVMLAAGFDYYRYMDDMRIVAPDEATARRGLSAAITHLRELELSVNGKKTGIVRPGSDEWNRLAAEPNTDFEEIEQIVQQRNVAELPKAVEQLNEMLLKIIEDGGRDHRRLGFCVGRLTAIRRTRKLKNVPEPDGAGPALLRLLRHIPQSTPNVCQYFLAGEPSDETFAAVVEMLTTEPLCVYGWQNYHMWLLAAAKGVVNTPLLERARAVVQQCDNSPELAGAAIYLGTVGAMDELRPIVKSLREKSLSVTVVRALVTAVQRLNDDALPGVISGLAGKSATLSVLDGYISRLRKPHYLSPPRRVSLRRLPDELPDHFSGF